MSVPFDVGKRASVSSLCLSICTLSLIGVSGQKFSGGCWHIIRIPAISLRTAAFLVLLDTASASLQITNDKATVAQCWQ
jgi:hypothetical protein